MDRVELKENAKDSLRNKWAESIKIVLLFFIITSVIELIYVIPATGFVMNEGIEYLEHFDDLEGFPDYIQILKSISSIVTIIIEALITFGFTSFFLKISRNEDVTYKELFSKTSMWLKFIGATLLIGLFTVLGFICLIIPGIIVAIGVSQTYYILLDNPDIGIMDAIKQSWQLMKGHKLDYFILQLSFIGWAILAALSFGIGLLWLIPYMNVTECNFYNKLKEKLS